MALWVTGTRDFLERGPAGPVHDGAERTRTATR